MSARQLALEALKGVIAVADRQTDEFDRARAAIAALEADIAREVPPLAVVRAKAGDEGGVFIQWQQMPVAGMTIYTAPQEPAAPESVNEVLLTELQNIATANPKNWDAPYNAPESFQEWAQSRARAAIAKVGGAA